VFGSQASSRIDGRRGTRQGHEIRCPGGGTVQRIVRLQGNVNRAVTAFGYQVEAVIEKLAEKRKPAIEPGRQANIGRLVGYESQFFIRWYIVRGWGSAVMRFLISRDRERIAVPRCNSRGIRARHIDDQIANYARIGIGDASGDPIVIVYNDRRRLSRPIRVENIPISVIKEVWWQQARKDVVACAKFTLSWQEIVETPVCGAEAERRNRCFRSDNVDKRFSLRMPLGDYDLLKDKIEISPVDSEIGVSHVNLLKDFRYFLNRLDSGFPKRKVLNLSCVKHKLSHV
jgi:hypothetical protein